MMSDSPSSAAGPLRRPDRAAEAQVVAERLATGSTEDDRKAVASFVAEEKPTFTGR